MAILEKLLILPPSTSKLFYFPLQGKDKFVRTGTIGDGSCLFHAMCHAYSSEYVHMTDDQKKDLVSRLRNNITKDISKSKWKGLNNSIISVVSFQEKVNKIITYFYKLIENDKSLRTKSISLRKVADIILVNKHSINIYSSLFQLITLQDIIGGGGVLESSYRDCSNIDMCIENVMKNLRDIVRRKLEGGGLERDRVDFLTEKFIMLIDCVLAEAEDSSYKKYIHDLQDSKTYIDQYQIDLISDKFNVDIYFINAHNRLPYMTGSAKNTYKQRTSFIVLWIGDNHYEIIGRVIEGTNHVERKFNPDDPIIKMLYTLHCNPTKFANKYPQYISYLPLEVRDSFGVKSDIDKYDDDEYRDNYSSNDDDI